MRLTTLCLAFSAVIAASVAHAQDAKITFSPGATTIDAALAQLSQATNTRLAASGSVRGEVVFVHAKDQTLDQIRSQLAAAMNAEWRQDGDQWFLARSGVVETQERQAEIAQRAARLKAEVDKIAAENAQLNAFDATEAQRIAGQFQAAGQAMMTGGGNWRRFVELSNQLPAGRVLAQVLPQMNLADFAAMPSGSRRVFSTSPTRMQGRLPQQVMAMARKMVEQQRLFEKTALDAFGEGAMMFVNGGRQGAAPGGDVAVVMLVATSTGGDTLNLNLIAANAAGEALATGNLTLGIPPETQPGSAATKLGEGKSVRLSEESKELLAVLRTSMRGGGFFGGGRGGNMTMSVVAATGSNTGPAVNAGQSLLAKLARPDAHDPMSYFVSDGLRSWAEAAERNVVAVLPDSAFSTLQTALSGTDPKTDAVIGAFPARDFNWKDENGWAHITPKFPAQSRERVDRVALARLIASLRRTGVPMLDDVATYMATAPAPAFGGFGGFEPAFMSAAIPGLPTQQIMQIFGPERDAMRFYGRLAGSQRQALKGGQTLQIGSLAPPQREALERLVFWSFDGPRLQQQQQQGGGERRQMAMRFGAAAFGFGANVAEERTVLLANGLPSMGAVTMRGEPAISVLARSKGGAPALMSTWALAANRLALSGGMNRGPMGVAMTGTEYDQYQVVTEVEWDLSFLLGPNYTMTRELSDPQVDPNARWVAYGDLPVPFRNEVEQAMSRMQEGDRRGGGGGMRGPGGAGSPRP